MEELSEIYSMDAHRSFFHFFFFRWLLLVLLVLFGRGNCDFFSFFLFFFFKFFFPSGRRRPGQRLDGPYAPFNRENGNHNSGERNTGVDSRYQAICNGFTTLTNWKYAQLLDPTLRRRLRVRPATPSVRPPPVGKYIGISQQMWTWESMRFTPHLAEKVELLMIYKAINMFDRKIKV